jgi:hypothetical protein
MLAALRPLLPDPLAPNHDQGSGSTLAPPRRSVCGEPRDCATLLCTVALSARLYHKDLNRDCLLHIIRHLLPETGEQPSSPLGLRDATRHRVLLRALGALSPSIVI